jgi:16S rRNA (guanine(966)-N(2))-methyltransferase RsmD
MGGLKILSGDARGRVLNTLKSDDLSIRPMLGRMKKSLFDIIRPRLEGCEFLDLFAGTGAVGLEALSNGARRVVFVEQSPVSLKLIKENIDMLGYSDRGVIQRADVVKGLEWLKLQFDIIFMGPPYKDDKKRPLFLTSPALSAVARGGLLAPGGWIICQHHKKEPVRVPEGLEIFRQEKYGDTLVTFVKGGKA